MLEWLREIESLGTYYVSVEKNIFLKEVDKRPILGYVEKGENNRVNLDILIDCSAAGSKIICLSNFFVKGGFMK